MEEVIEGERWGHPSPGVVAKRFALKVRPCPVLMTGKPGFLLRPRAKLGKDKALTLVSMSAGTASIIAAASICYLSSLCGYLCSLLSNANVAQHVLPTIRQPQ